MENFKATISVPSDSEGYVLLKCPHCGTYFKCTVADIEDDGLLELHCPSCGLASDSFLTDDVRELALTKVSNNINEQLFQWAKGLEHSMPNNGFVSFKAPPPPKQDFERPIRAEIDALEPVYFPCCHRTAKVKPLLKMTGCYCPFCGVKDYGTESN